MKRLTDTLRKKKGHQPVGRDDDFSDDGTVESGSVTSRARLNKHPRSDAYGKVPRRPGPGSAYGGSDVGSEISAGPEKWRRVRRGAHLSYMPFDVEEQQDNASDVEGAPEEVFPPPSETSDDVKNWPKSCPFLHLKFAEFAIKDKRSFISTSYYFWYFLILVLLWNLLSAVVTQLISPSPKEDNVYFAFLFGFIGFWWFFFAHFRLVYMAMRYRKSVLYTLYQLETVCLFFLAIFQIFTLVGSMTQLLAPLAPGSPVPVRQNPMLATILQGIGTAGWMIVMLFCFYFIRKAHYFKNLPLSIEREIWRKEREPSVMDVQSKRFSEWFLNKFREKPDKPVPPERCGMLQGKDLWLQGMLTLGTVALEFRADVHVFDHLVWERFHYQDVLSVRKYGKSGILFQVVHPTKRQLEDLEIIFDLSSPKVRAKTYKAARNLWRRVGRNMDLLAREHHKKLKKMRRLGRAADMDVEEPDIVEAFNKARRLETRERLADNLVTYKDWQRILYGVKIHVLTQGETLLAMGDDVSCIYHVAQGTIEVSEMVDAAGSTVGSEAVPGVGGHSEEFKAAAGDSREQMSYAKALAKRRVPKGGAAALEEKSEDVVEYEDPEDALPPPGHGDSGSSESEEEGEDDDATLTEGGSSDSDSVMDSDIYSIGIDQGPETVLLGTLRKDDIFGVVPFLLAREGQLPKSGLSFTASDPQTVVFSVDSNFLKTELLKPKKDITAALYKYLAVILGERTEAAEDAMFNRKLREKRLEVARAEEHMLALQRQQEEEQGIGADKATAVAAATAAMGMSRDQAVRAMFNFSASEAVEEEFKGKYTWVDRATKKECKVSGTLYITTHYFAFAGKKLVDVNHLEVNRQHKNIMRNDEVITIRYAGTRGVLFTDVTLGRKMFEVKRPEQQEHLYQACMARWKGDGETTSAEMRKLLRRKMSRLSLGYLTQAEMLTQQSIGALLADMSEKEKKQLFAGSVPIGLNRNQIVIGEHNFNDNLYLLCTGIVRVQRVKEHVSNVLDSGKAMDRVVFQEIHSGEIFGFDSFLTGAPAFSSVVVDSDKAVVRSCTKDQIMARLREDRRLAAKFYRISAISIAARLAEISPLDIYL